MPRNKPRPSTYLPRRFPWLTGKKTRVEKVIAFLEYLPITKGILRGKKMRLLPHQREFVELVYGGDVRLAVSSVARGNGKTGLIAGLVCCHLFGPEAEPRGEIYSAACNTKQAALVFAEVDAIVRAVEEFKEFRIKTTSFWHKMEVLSGPGVGTVYAVLSGEKQAAHGLAPTLWIFDELGIAPDRQLLDALMTASGKRDRSLGIAISTQASDDRHSFSQLIDDAAKNKDPTIVCSGHCRRRRRRSVRRGGDQAGQPRARDIPQRERNPGGGRTSEAFAGVRAEVFKPSLKSARGHPFGEAAVDAGAVGAGERPC